MQILIFIVLLIVIVWVLFRPVTQKELNRFNNKDNRPNLDL